MLNNDFYSIIYVLISLVIALRLTLKCSKNTKYINFLICYWILAGAVFNNPILIPTIRVLELDFQPARFLGILFSIWLLNKYLGYNKKEELMSIKLPFLKYFFLFIFFVFLSMYYHSQLGMWNTTKVIVKTTQYLNWILIFYAVKENVDEIMTSNILYSIIIVCLFSVSIAFIQYFVDDYFFRLGSKREVYGDILRAIAFYDSEFYQAYIVILGIFVTFFVIKNPLWKWLVVLFFVIGIILTFLRTSYFVLIVALLIYFISVRKTPIAKVFAFAGFQTLLMFTFSSTSIEFQDYQSQISNSDIVQERFLADTGTSRLEQYYTVFLNLGNNFFFGVGDEKLGDYQLESGGIGKLDYNVHNTFLRFLFLYGFPAFLAFSMFMYSLSKFLFSLYKMGNFYNFIPFIFTVNFILGSQTIGIEFYTEISIYIAILAGVGVGLHQKKIKIKFPNEFIK